MSRARAEIGPNDAGPRDRRQPIIEAIQIYRILIVIAIVLLWYVLTTVGLLDPFFFGHPLPVFRIILNWFVSGYVYPHLMVTLVETLLSFAIGTALGIGTGLLLGLNPYAARLCDPFIKAANSTPRVVLAPIFALWFGLGIWSKVALGTTLVYFIVFFNVYQGIREVSPVVLANVRMLGASSGQLLRRVYLPSATSWVFSSLHNAVGMAFVGSVIGEYLGSAKGIGFLILQAEGSFDVDTVFAGIITLTIFALLLDAIVSWAETRLLKWRPTAGHTERAQT